jgi:hypothetical protein
MVAARDACGLSAAFCLIADNEGRATQQTASCNQELDPTPNLFKYRNYVCRSTLFFFAACCNKVSFMA